MPLWMTSPKKQAKLRTLHRSVQAETGQLCLDIGHGSGAVHGELAAIGGTWLCTMVAASDVNHHTRPGEWVSLVTGPKDLPFVSRCFDTICAVDILEHLEDDKEFLHELHRVLRDRGLLYLTVPRLNGHLLLRNWRMRAALGRDHHRHVRDGYTEAELRALLERSGFQTLFTRTFSGLFTEVFDVLCNVLYRRLTGERGRAGLPGSAADFGAHPVALVFYRLIQPFIVVLRALDAIFPADSYGLFVAAHRLEACATQGIETCATQGWKPVPPKELKPVLPKGLKR